MSGFTGVLKSFIPAPKTGEQRSQSVSLASLFGFGSTTNINANTALTIPAYYRGVMQIANDIAKLPKGVFQKTDKGRLEVPHKVKFLINREASPIMSAFTFHFLMVSAALNRGNGLALIIRNENTGDIDSLFFVHPDDLKQILLFQGVVYYVTTFGTYTQDEVIHIMGFTDDGYTGKSVIKYAAETLGIAKAAQNFTQGNFENKGIGFGIIETDKIISQKSAKQSIESAVNEKLGSSGRINTAVLDEGMKYKPITLNMQEAQLIEQAAFSVLDIARFLVISPRKLGDYSKQSYASAYQDGVDHVGDSIQPWAKKFEQEYDRKLFTPTEKETHYTKFNDNYLLRADLQAKGDYYSKMIYAGVFNRNEVRGFEEMNSADGLDEHLTPVNTKLPEEILKGLQDGK